MQGSGLLNTKHKEMSIQNLEEHLKSFRLNDSEINTLIKPEPILSIKASLTQQKRALQSSVARLAQMNYETFAMGNFWCCYEQVSFFKIQWSDIPWLAKNDRGLLQRGNGAIECDSPDYSLVKDSDVGKLNDLWEDWKILRTVKFETKEGKLVHLEKMIVKFDGAGLKRECLALINFWQKHYPQQKQFLTIEKIDRRVLGQSLKKARQTRGISQNIAAGIINVSRGTMSAIETGNRKVSEEQLLTLANAYKYPLSHFVSV